MEPLPAKILYLIGIWLANFAIRFRHIQAHRRTPIRMDRKSSVDSGLFFAVSLGGFLLPLFYVFTSWLSFADYHIPLWVGICGVALLILGNWLFWRSHRDLGPNWSPTMEIRESHQLVTTGIYARIRHPMYTALFLLCAAQAMILPNWLAGCSGLVLFVMLYLYRVRREEQMMSEVFGPAYAQYIKQTGRLLPRFKK